LGFVILFALICLIPFEIPLKNYLYRFIDTDNNPKQYLDVYFDFEHDYQRSNPITIKSGYFKYISYLLDKHIISDDEYHRIKNIINNDEAWRFLRNQERPNVTTSKILNKITSMLELIARKSSFLEKGRLRKVALKKFLNVFGMEQKEEFQDFGDLLVEVESVLLKKKQIDTRKRNEIEVFRSYMSSSKKLKDKLKTEYQQISNNTNLIVETIGDGLIGGSDNLIPAAETEKSTINSNIRRRKTTSNKTLAKVMSTLGKE
jgi:hypothetical protein